MARDLDAIKITRKWANTGFTAAITEESVDEGVINREKGFPPRYSDPTAQGRITTIRQINQVFKEITGLCLEINRGQGIGEFSAARSYVHPATVWDAGQIYKSQSGVPSAELALNRPSTDADRSHWEPLVASGLVVAEEGDYPEGINNMGSTGKYVTPQGLIDWALGKRNAGGVRSGGLIARADHSHSDLPGASETVRGIIRLAILSLVTSGSNHTQGISPLRMRQAGGARYSGKTHTHSGYALAGHNHDSVYAKEDHTHG